jgi:predicted DsbA family dithiol-disulfide isomerase
VTVVHVIYYTDPACPWSWAAEPALRRIQGEFGAGVAITYVMGGLAREFKRPVETARHVLDASAAGGMPVDARIWLEDPPRSSHPACLAVVAASEQGLAGPALRRVREGLMLDRLRLDTPDALAEALRTVPGMDAARLQADLESSATRERFEADLERVRRAAPEHHNAAGRVPFPSFEVEGVGGVYDEEVTPDALSALVRRAGGEPAQRPDVPGALGRWGRIALGEVAEATGLPLERAAVELWGLALDVRARPELVGSGYMWRPASA